MKKKYVTILLSLMLPLAPLTALAVNDVTFNESSQLSVSGYILVVTGTPTTIDSIVVNAADFSVTLSPSSSFGISSVDRRRLTVDSKTYVQVSDSCDSSQSAMSMVTTQDIGSITVTVTPSTSETCSVSGGGGGAPGSTGGVYVAPVAPAIPAVPATPAEPTVSPATPATPAVPAVSALFSKGLSRGMNNADTKRLQQLLASDPALYPEGLTTGYFGSLTEKAVQRFQKKYGVASEGAPGYGYVGPKTRAKLNEVYGSATPATPAEPTVSPATPATPAAPSGVSEAELQSQLDAAQKLLDELLKQMQGL